MARVGDGAGPKSRDGDGAGRGEVGGAWRRRRRIRAGRHVRAGLAGLNAGPSRSWETVSALLLALSLEYWAYEEF